MTKSTKDIIKHFKTKYEIDLTFKHFSLGDSYLDAISENLGEQIIVKRRIDYHLIQSLKTLINDYPDLPIFYNYLYTSYLIDGKIQRAKDIVDQVLIKFPKYIFGCTQKASFFIFDNLFDDAKKYIGDSLDIKERFPKDVYHVSEIKSYLLAHFELAIREEKVEKLKDILRMLWELYEDQGALYQHAKRYNALSFSKVKYFDHTYTDIEDKEKTVLDIEVQPFDDDIYNLVSNREYYDDEVLLLKKYKPEYLCNELYKICVSAYSDDYNDYDYEVIPEAFMLLSIANYQAAYPLFITYLSQNKEFVEYFWEENGQIVVEIAFNFGKTNPDPLIDFIMQDDVDDFMRSAVTEALVQLVLNNYLQREKLSKYLDLLIDKFLKRLENGSFIPTYYLNCLTSYFVKFNERSLLEKSKPFFDNEKIDNSFFGTYKYHLKELDEWELKYAKEHFPKNWKDYILGTYLKLNEKKPITDDERNLMNEVLGNPFENFLMQGFSSLWNNDDQYEYEDTAEPIKPIVKANKIGRNDLCPCGSGKKYKKCCINIKQL